MLLCAILHKQIKWWNQKIILRNYKEYENKIKILENFTVV